ncbi:low choriolytic enzyme-like [Paralichthys olivaceus]|uniref:low choriolytic enzyme-like n=1 Tax=Paralichthys olivaceus TaxID=8255 RepID=UPI0037517694
MTPVFLLLLFFSMSAMAAAAALKGQVLAESKGVSDVIEKANAGLTNLTSGDIAIVTDVQSNADPCTSAGCLWPKRKNVVSVYYKLDSAFNQAQKEGIMGVLSYIQHNTCIQFKRHRKKNTNHLNIFSGAGCWSYVGRQGNEQLLSLNKDGCLYTSIVQHEILHALGFHHEHMRSDRNQHVIINWENIQEGKERNFNEVPTNNLGTPYDFDSVMQYSNTAFSKNGQPTIEDINNPSHVFGYAPSMSPNDILRINRLYQCI